MIRKSIIAVLMLAATITTVQAAERKFTVSGEAKATGDQVLVKASISEIKPDGTTAVVSRPQLLLNAGTRGDVVVGSEIPRPPVTAVAPTMSVSPSPRAAATKTAAAAAAPVIDSGLKMDVISVKGGTDVLVVTTIIDKGATIWADAQRIPISAAPVARP